MKADLLEEDEERMPASSCGLDCPRPPGITWQIHGRYIGSRMHALSEPCELDCPRPAGITRCGSLCCAASRSRWWLTQSETQRAWKGESGHPHWMSETPGSAPRPILRTAWPVSSERRCSFSRGERGSVASHCIMCWRSVQVR